MNQAKGRVPALSMISACLRGAPSGVFVTLICVHESNSRMIWSKGKPAAITALTTASGAIQGTRRSAAQPIRCWLVSLEPTLSLTCFDLNPELIMIGLPSSAVFTCSKNSASRRRFANSESLGVLSNCLWLVAVSSSSEKCSVRFIFYSTNLSWPENQQRSQNNTRLSPSRLCRDFPTSSGWRGCCCPLCQ